jgi:hypothetical protein
VPLFRSALARLGLILTLLSGCAVGVHAEQPGQPGQDAAVLVTTFADGRTTHTVVTRRPRSSWTPLFPRLPGWREASDLPITALKFVRTLGDSNTVTVAVAVLRGAAREREDPIATVVIGPNDVVTIQALRAVGVAPVTLSLTALGDTTLHQPLVVNRTAGLEVTDIELVMTPRPHYRISVTNVSSQPAVNFHVAAHQGGQRALSGNRGNRDASAIIAPGDTYSFDLDASSGAPPTAAGWAPLPHDVIEIAAVLWEDGTIEGEAAPMAAALSLYRGRQVQLTRGLALLRAARDVSAPATARTRLREQIERLPVEPDEAVLSGTRERLQHLEDLDVAAVAGALRTAMAETRKGMLDDLSEAPDGAAAFDQWLDEIIALYEQWRDRFAAR